MSLKAAIRIAAKAPVVICWDKATAAPVWEAEADALAAVADAEPDERSEIYVRSLSALSTICIDLDEMSEAPGSTDDSSNEVHAIVLETLRAIVEQIGDILTRGWDIVFDIICTAFAQTIDEEEVTGSEIPCSCASDQRVSDATEPPRCVCSSASGSPARTVIVASLRAAVPTGRGVTPSGARGGRRR